jgi:hypothetical protein
MLDAVNPPFTCDNHMTNKALVRALFRLLHVAVEFTDHFLYSIVCTGLIALESPPFAIRFNCLVALVHKEVR